MNDLHSHLNIRPVWAVVWAFALILACVLCVPYFSHADTWQLVPSNNVQQALSISNDGQFLDIYNSPNSTSTSFNLLQVFTMAHSTSTNTLCAQYSQSFLILLLLMQFLCLRFLLLLPVLFGLIILPRRI